LHNGWNLAFHQSIIPNKNILSLDDDHWHVCVDTCDVFEIIVFNENLSIKLFILCCCKQTIFIKTDIHECIVPYANHVVDIRIFRNLEPYLERNVRLSRFRVNLGIIIVYVYKVLILILAQRNVFWISTDNSERFWSPLSIDKVSVGDCYVHGLIDDEEAIETHTVFSSYYQFV
jgi:hypothetical protein